MSKILEAERIGQIEMRKSRKAWQSAEGVACQQPHQQCLQTWQTHAAEKYMRRTLDSDYVHYQAMRAADHDCYSWLQVVRDRWH